MASNLKGYISAEIDIELEEAVRRDAFERRLTKSEYVRVALRNELDRKPAQIRNEVSPGFVIDEDCR